jgi:hypothetical protein
VNLKNTLFNLNLSKNKFFNIKHKSYVNSDILKSGVLYFWEYGNKYSYKHNKKYNRVHSVSRKIRNVIISPPNCYGWNMYFFNGNEINDNCMDWYLYL